MESQTIRTEDEYYAAISRLEKLMGSKPGTEESQELDALADLLVAYESKHFPIDEPDPEFLRRFELEQRGEIE